MSEQLMEEKNADQKKVLFWDIFCDDFRVNCLSWKHSGKNPVMPPEGTSWKKNWTANPDYIEFAGKKLIYYRGNGVSPKDTQHNHDRIAVAEMLEIDDDSIVCRDLNEANYVIDVGDPGEFDDRDVLDPAAVEFEGKVFLYYSAIGNGPDSVGLAVSEDGIHFEKKGNVLRGRAPDVVVKDGMIQMIYQLEGDKGYGGGYRGFYLAQSPDGVHFTQVFSTPVFNASESNNWDCQISTARLFQQGEHYYMLYGGNPSKVDQPDYFGLARSTDLVHWERHPGNPIFGCGAKGAEDGGAIWFPALIETQAQYVMLYEGARGDYNWSHPSQICLSSIKKETCGGK